MHKRSTSQVFPSAHMKLRPPNTHHPSPDTRHKTPDTRHPTPYTQLYLFTSSCILPTLNPRLQTPNSKLSILNFQFSSSQDPTPNSQLPTPNSQLPTLNFLHLPTQNSDVRAQNYRAPILSKSGSKYCPTLSSCNPQHSTHPSTPISQFPTLNFLHLPTQNSDHKAQNYRAPIFFESRSKYFSSLEQLQLSTLNSQLSTPKLSTPNPQLPTPELSCFQTYIREKRFDSSIISKCSREAAFSQHTTPDTRHPTPNSQLPTFYISQLRIQM